MQAQAGQTKPLTVRVQVTSATEIFRLYYFVLDSVEKSAAE